MKTSAQSEQFFSHGIDISLFVHGSKSRHILLESASTLSCAHSLSIISGIRSPTWLLSQTLMWGLYTVGRLWWLPILTCKWKCLQNCVCMAWRSTPYPAISTLGSCLQAMLPEQNAGFEALQIFQHCKSCLCLQKQIVRDSNLDRQANRTTYSKFPVWIRPSATILSLKKEEKGFCIFA